MNWPLEFERCLDKRWLVKMPEAGYLVTTWGSSDCQFHAAKLSGSAIGFSGVTGMNLCVRRRGGYLFSETDSR